MSHPSAIASCAPLGGLVLATAGATAARPDLGLPGNVPARFLAALRTAVVGSGLRPPLPAARGRGRAGLAAGSSPRRDTLGTEPGERRQRSQPVTAGTASGSRAQKAELGLWGVCGCPVSPQRCRGRGGSRASSAPARAGPRAAKSALAVAVTDRDLVSQCLRFGGIDPTEICLSIKHWCVLEIARYFSDRREKTLCPFLNLCLLKRRERESTSFCPNLRFLKGGVSSK